MNIQELKEKIEQGQSFELLSELYPKLPPSLFKKLGGKVVPKFIQRKENGSFGDGGASGSDYYTSWYSGVTDRLKLIGKERADWVCYASIFGDGHISKPNPSTYFVETHAIGQLPLALYKASLLGSRLSSVRFIDNDVEGQDDLVKILSTSYPGLAYLRSRLYTKSKIPGKFFKDFVNSGVIGELELEALAIWVMDDGLWYGGNKFAISVGITEDISFQYTEELARQLSNQFGVVFTSTPSSPSGVVLVPDSTSFCLSIREYLLPQFSYKIGVPPSVCGSSISASEEITSVCQTFRHRKLSKWGNLSDLDKKKTLKSQIKVGGVPPLKEPSLQDLEAIRNSETKHSSGVYTPSNFYNRVPSYFFPHRYKVRCSGHRTVDEVFSRSSYLNKVVAMQIESGDAVNPSNIRNAICAYGAKVPGQFSPLLAKSIIEEFCPKGGVIYDPCSGWGGRMCGAFAAGAKYVGNDVSPITVEGLQKLSSFLGSSFPIYCRRAEEFVPDIEADLCFTSPPYFDLEEYVGGDQSHLLYKTYSEWETHFLHKMLDNCLALTKKRGFLVINVGTERIKASVEAWVKNNSVLLRAIRTIRTPSTWSRDKNYGEFVIIMENTSC